MQRPRRQTCLVWMAGLIGAILPAPAARAGIVIKSLGDRMVYRFDIGEFKDCKQGDLVVLTPVESGPVVRARIEKVSIRRLRALLSLDADVGEAVPTFSDYRAICFAGPQPAGALKPQRKAPTPPPAKPAPPRPTPTPAAPAAPVTPHQAPLERYTQEISGRVSVINDETTSESAGQRSSPVKEQGYSVEAQYIYIFRAVSKLLSVGTGLDLGYASTTEQQDQEVSDGFETETKTIKTSRNRLTAGPFFKLYLGELMNQTAIPFFGAGYLYSQGDAETTDLGITESSGSEIKVNLGLHYFLVRSVSVTPEIRYQVTDETSTNGELESTESRTRLWMAIGLSVFL